jgi:rod shape-determining protein MreC
MNSSSARTLVFYILAALCLVLLILSASGRLVPVEGVLNSGTRPILLAFNGASRQISNVIQTARDFSNLRTRNEQLQTAANTLTIENLRLKEVEGENERLRRLLGFQQLNPIYDYRGGQLIGRVTVEGPSNYLRTIGIDLGSEHAIKADMPVVTERGLVGRIRQVGPNSSTVLLITDPSSAVNALIQRNRVVGVVEGQPGALPVMRFIPQEADVTVGDLVITSGLGGNFPRNLVIGQVIEVHKHDYDMFQEATVRPTVNFDRLEIVLVITNFKPLPGQPEELESVG